MSNKGKWETDRATKGRWETGRATKGDGRPTEQRRELETRNRKSNEGGSERSIGQRKEIGDNKRNEEKRKTERPKQRKYDITLHRYQCIATMRDKRK